MLRASPDFGLLKRTVRPEDMRRLCKTMLRPSFRLP